MNEITKAKRGFALISPERRKEIASMGGKTSQAKGTAHRFNKETAREAGQKGGRNRWISRDESTDPDKGNQ